MAKELKIRVGLDSAAFQAGLRGVTSSLSGAASRIAGIAGRITALFGGLSFAATLAEGTRQALSFGDALARLSTLGLAGDDLDRVSEAARRFATEFGGTAADQVQAFYDVFSAGAQNSSEAITILDAANRIALGGLGDVKTAVDSVTSILNAYGLQASDATRITDILQTTIKRGKTTLAEIGSSISNATVLAASLGVSFEEVSAALAVLTAKGTPTAEAITQIRGLLVGLVNSGRESSLATKGFAGTLAEIIQETGGSIEALKGLIGRIEGVQAALALGEDNASAFVKNIKELNDVQGAAAEAALKRQSSVTAQLRLLWNSILDIVQTFINAISTSSLERIVAQARQLAALLRSAASAGRFGELVGLSLKVAFGEAINYLIGGLRSGLLGLSSYLTNLFSADGIKLLVNGLLGAAAKFGVAVINVFRDAIAFMAAGLTVAIQKALEFLPDFVKRALGLESFKADTFDEAFRDQRERYQPEFVNKLNALADQQLAKAGAAAGRILSRLVEDFKAIGQDFKPAEVINTAEWKAALAKLAAELNVAPEAIEEVAKMELTAPKPETPGKPLSVREAEVDQFQRVGLFAGGTADQMTAFTQQIAQWSRKSAELLAGTLKVQMVGGRTLVVGDT